jgi:hypothetical protein
LATWTSNGVEEKTMERFQDIKRLKDYLEYLTLKKEYEAKKANASLTLEKKKVDYALQQLHVFYEKVNFTMQLFYLLGLIFIAITCFVNSHLGSHILRHSNL